MFMFCLLGSWLELDDLKHPHSIIHKRFSFPANEIHVVFWESDSTKEQASEVCSLTAPSALSNVEDKHLHELSDSVADDTCVISALTVGDSTATGALDTSIGSATLLDTFEGLSHTDIVTLTLVDENKATEALQIPQSPAVVPAALPTLPVTSSSSCISKSVCQPSKPQSSGLKECSSVSNPVVVRPSVATQVHAPSPLAFSLLQRHPSFQSTPIRLSPPAPKPILKCDNEALPAKPADMFGGFLSEKLPNSSGGNPAVAPQHKQVTLPAGICGASKKDPSLLANQQPISTTEALRLKLLKKLKAKKKKLAKLNQLLGSAGESAPKPDSTALSSPYSVTSSTAAYDSPAYDQFFAELLSPATTVTNLSPDSTGLLEMLNNGQNAEKTQQNPSVPTVVPEATLTYPSSTNDSVLNLDEYIQSGMGQTAIDNTDFNGLDIFFWSRKAFRFYKPWVWSVSEQVVPKNSSLVSYWECKTFVRKACGAPSVK